MTEAIYRDLLIVSEDVVLDDGNNPEFTTDRIVIAQDIKHAILESGLAVQLVAERSPANIVDVERQIILLAENDARVIPGTASVKRVEAGRLLIATTYEFGELVAWL